MEEVTGLNFHMQNQAKHWVKAGMLGPVEDIRLPRPLSHGLAWKLVLFVMYVAPPLFCLIALEFFLRLRGRGLMSHQPWVRLAMLLWLGVLLLFAASACTAWALFGSFVGVVQRRTS